MDFPIIAGTISTTLFAVSMLPMLAKAARSRDLASYSLTNIAMTNLANVVHSFYVFSLPLGPIWLLHGFYGVASGLMLIWFFRYARTADRSAGGAARLPTPTKEVAA